MKVTYQKEGTQYRLYLDGETCGPRLVKGGVFPLRREKWWMCSTEAEAQKSCVQLKAYIEDRNNSKEK